MASSSVSCEMKTYPAKEFRAVDMAELIRSLTLFEGERRDENTTVPVNGGIIEGCDIRISTNPANKIRIQRGRILIAGRLAEVKPSGNSDYLYLDPPNVSASNTTCVIAAVCDLSEPNAPFYITIADGVGTLNQKANRTTDANFNRGNGLRYLRLGTVKVNPNGTMSDLVKNDNSTEIKSNKKTLNAVRTELLNRIGINDDWNSYFQKSRHKADFFTAYRVSADGLTLAKGAITTFKFRSEYGSKVYIRSSSGSGSNVIPGDPDAYVEINPAGTILSEKGDTRVYPAPAVDEHGVPASIIENPNKWKFLGINEIHIENARTDGIGATNCMIQSYYTEAASGNGGHICVAIRNTGNVAAKIKLTVRSMYVADIG